MATSLVGRFAAQPVSHRAGRGRRRGLRKCKMAYILRRSRRATRPCALQSWRGFGLDQPLQRLQTGAEGLRHPAVEQELAHEVQRPDSFHLDDPWTSEGSPRAVQRNADMASVATSPRQNVVAMPMGAGASVAARRLDLKTARDARSRRAPAGAHPPRVMSAALAQLVGPGPSVRAGAGEDQVARSSDQVPDRRRRPAGYRRLWRRGLGCGPTSPHRVGLLARARTSRVRPRTPEADALAPSIVATRS